MKRRTSLAVGAALAMAAAVMMTGAAAAEPHDVTEAAVVNVTEQATIVMYPKENNDFTTLGTDIKDCYYSGGYLGCSYFWHAPSPENFTVCDEVWDGRYTKGRIKFDGNVYELGPVETTPGWYACIVWRPQIAEGNHLGIHTGVEGLGWTPYEYGYA